MNWVRIEGYWARSQSLCLANARAAPSVCLSRCLWHSPRTRRQVLISLSLALNVVVTDKSGKPVSGLAEQDFTLLDNKRPEKITSFEAVQGSGANHTPLAEVVLLMDDVNTGITNAAYERQQVVKFLERDNGVLSHPVLCLPDSSGDKGGL